MAKGVIVRHDHDINVYINEQNKSMINQEHTEIILKLEIDTNFGEISEYFEIFTGRMLLCRKAAGVLTFRRFFPARKQKFPRRTNRAGQGSFQVSAFSCPSETAA
ncbi:MAG: hypothetical protein IKX19_09845 [Clostridia bacterium]|nr:hypothetical protein [Clostridia bacterium]